MKGSDQSATYSVIKSMGSSAVTTDRTQTQFIQDQALFCLKRSNPIRKLCIRTASSKYFDLFIILIIILNSLLLGCTDYSVLDDNLAPVSNGKKFVNGRLENRTSTMNWVIEKSELPFTAIFTAECVIKIIAMGLFMGKTTYLRDSWNRLDCIVVISSLVGIFPGVPNVSAIRTIRILRPLRSLSAIPGMRRLISALLTALPALGNVVLLQIFVFSIFGILGIQLFGGNLNTRCRLTEFPVKLELNSIGEPIWPPSPAYLDDVIKRPEEYRCLHAPLVDLPTIEFLKETSPWRTPHDCFWPLDTNDNRLCDSDGTGNHGCPTNRTCGSNYDIFGNPRFKNFKVMDAPLHHPDFNWGYTSFDNIGQAFFTIFQSITEEGWTVIMYMCMDTSSPLVSALFFVILIIFAALFLMNLTLAVISEEFNLDEQEQKPAEESKATAGTKFTGTISKKGFLTRTVTSSLFSSLIMLVILTNTIVLSLDHHPMPPELDARLEVINFGLSCVFILEMLMKLFGLGAREYVRDKFNIFDAFVVIMGILETIASPPSFITNEVAKKGAVSALRSFRLFRVFKLARNWKSLRELLGTIGRTIAGIANFAVLLFLFIYIYALMGLQFFSNTLHFDKEGYVLQPSDPEFWRSEIPRNNFDSLLWACVTVFQVISGENWNNIMYDSIRANGFIASFYFISLIILGDFILMNLFLALLLDNFGGDEDPKDKDHDLMMVATKVNSMKVIPINVAIEEISTVAQEEASAFGQRAFNTTNSERAFVSRHIDTEAFGLSDCEGEEDSQLEDQKSHISLIKPDPVKMKLCQTNTLVKDDSTERAKAVDQENFCQEISTIQASTSSQSNDNSNNLIEPSICMYPVREHTGNCINNSTANSRMSSSFLPKQPCTPANVLSNSRIKTPSRNYPDRFASAILSESSVSEIRDTRSLRYSFALSSKSFETGDDMPEKITEQLPPAGKSLLLFSERNSCRRTVFRIISDQRFDNLVLSMITISSIALAVDNPLADPNATLPRFLKMLDNVFTVAFLIEMMSKVFALGLVGHKGSYLRNNWNVIDGFIVVLSTVMFITEILGGSSNSTLGKSLRSLRSLRTFRPLRMISRRPGLKLVVNALFESIPAVLNVTFVCMLFYLIFSIVAVNYLKGTFYACGGTIYENLEDIYKDFLNQPTTWLNTDLSVQTWFMGQNSSCAKTLDPNVSMTSRFVCECIGAKWSPALPQNFDNVGRALLTFFEMSTTEGWADIMMAAIDKTEIDMQPIRDNNTNWAYFFVAFLMIGSFFVINLFVGVIIENFNRMKAALGGDFMLTPEQKKWIEAQKAASRVGPIHIIKPPRERLRRRIYDFIKMKSFEWFVMVCIITNTALMATQYFGESTTQDVVISIINEVFAGIFTLEAALKLIAFGSAYFEDNWNRFDFVVVLGTLLSMIMEALTGTSVRSLTMLVRVIRVTRILRLVKASKSIRQIFLTLYIALPGLSNITSILFLMLFIYATMGVQLFAKVALTDNITPHANFQDFWTAILFLLRISTGENWNGCMHDFASMPKGCDEDPDFNASLCGFSNDEDCIPINGCGTPIAYVYFCTFTLLVTYVMLNLTIAVILEGFSLSHEDETPLYEPELLQEFQVKWANIEPKGRGIMKVSKLLLLLNTLEPPLCKHGIGINRKDLYAYLKSLRLQLYEEETVVFKDVLLAMMREMVRKMTSSGEMDSMSDLPSNSLDEAPRRKIEYQAHEYFAVRQIQRSVSEWLQTKRNLEAQYMEEYRSKIKKPGGRPKKLRDARVYTIG